MISARDVAEIVPPRRRGRKMHRSTFHRWCTRGQDGVVLESIRIGGQRFTTVEALQSFFARLTEVERARNPSDRAPTAAPDHGAQASPTALGNSRRHRAVEAELERYGL